MKDMVLGPLNLQRTFLKFSGGGESPDNYATGHNDFGKEFPKFKNLDPIPASGINTTAEDYAKLLISFFDNKYLSPYTRRNILTPVIKLADDNPYLYYGPGYEIVYRDKDTIIAHGGNNGGFKAYIFYSVLNKCGMVFFTNGDLGKLIAQQLAKSAINLDVAPFFIGDYYEQYPCRALSLLKIFREKGTNEMLLQLDSLKKKEGGVMGPNTLNQLADILDAGGEVQLARKLLEENVRLYPSSALAVFLLGEVYLELKEYKLAYTYLKKAKEMNPTEVWIDYDLKRSFELMNSSK
jgi:tetratricopeptide (TPR) repeat protein